MSWIRPKSYASCTYNDIDVNWYIVRLPLSPSLQERGSSGHPLQYSSKRNSHSSLHARALARNSVPDLLMSVAQIIGIYCIGFYKYDVNCRSLLISKYKIVGRNNFWNIPCCNWHHRLMMGGSYLGVHRIAPYCKGICWFRSLRTLIND